MCLCILYIYIYLVYIYRKKITNNNNNSCKVLLYTTTRKVRYFVKGTEQNRTESPLFCLNTQLQEALSNANSL